VNDYIQEMEGPDAEVDPLTLRECAEVAEECLFGRTKTVALCIGNINEKESREVADVIQRHFIRKRPLLDDEVTRFRALILPTKLEATKMFGSIASEKVPIIYEALAHSESEENNSVELMIQTSSNHDLGYEGLAVQELISTIAYNSAFNQLRTKEQLGYIVSAFGKKIAGGGNAFCVLVQSSSTLPPAIEDSCLKWVEQFRQELEDMSEERLLMETNAVRASLLEKDVKLSEEISSVWNEILTTIPHSHHFKNPVFDRRERFAEILTIGGNVDNATSCSSIKTVAELKQKVLEFYDKYFMPNSPERRVVSSRVYNRKSKDVFEANVGKPGYISSYDDARKFKQQLSSFPTAPYW
jgi:secreted Zn-dependent insulinase-like peptidase